MKKKPTRPVAPPPPEVVQFNLPVNRIKIAAAYQMTSLYVFFDDPAVVTGRKPNELSFGVPFHPNANGDALAIGSAICALTWLTDKWHELTDLKGVVLRAKGTMHDGALSIDAIGHVYLERWIVRGTYPTDMHYPYGHGIRL